jgi:hypothetical protein
VAGEAEFVPLLLGLALGKVFNTEFTEDHWAVLAGIQATHLRNKKMKGFVTYIAGRLYFHRS